VVLFFFQHVTDRVAMYMHAYTLYSAVRPFGCGVILGTYDEGVPSMYMIDPSGVYHVRPEVVFLVENILVDCYHNVRSISLTGILCLCFGKGQAGSKNRNGENQAN